MKDYGYPNDKSKQGHRRANQKRREKVIATRNMWNLHQTCKERWCMYRKVFQYKEMEKVKLDLRAKEGMYKEK